jgi:hypothetical protein
MSRLSLSRRGEASDARGMFPLLPYPILKAEQRESERSEAACTK